MATNIFIAQGRGGREGHSFALCLKRGGRQEFTSIALHVFSDARVALACFVFERNFVDLGPLANNDVNRSGHTGD